jgi:hypothetical protein
VVCANILLVKPSYCKELSYHESQKQAGHQQSYQAGTQGARPHSYTQNINYQTQGRPPRQPRERGGRGENTQSQSTLILIGGIFKGKNKNGSKPNRIPLFGTERSYYCPLINFPPTTLSLILPLSYLSSLFGKTK